MSKRTDATGISKATREAVTFRDDGRCIFCGHPGMPEAHVVSRAQGGRGIPQNIVTVCRPCHDAMDHGMYRAHFVQYAKDYLRERYGTLMDETEIIYRKG